jgi:phosphate acetyltransferase
LDRISAKAKSDIKTIVLPEATDIRTLIAAQEATRHGIANIILVGHPDRIYELGLDIDLSQVQIMNPESHEHFTPFVHRFYEIRKHKGMTMENANETMKNPLYFGVMLVKEGLGGRNGGWSHPFICQHIKTCLANFKNGAGIQNRVLFFL